MNSIETFDLVKQYHKKTVIDNVNLQVPEGSIFGFVGENGAGKTTIMRLISGLAEPTSGSYAINGVKYKDRAIYEERSKMASIIEAPSLIPTMTARDNLSFACLYLGIKEPDLNGLLSTVNLKNTGKKKIKDFSLGMKQRLGIAMSLLNNPSLMLLDEPMNGLDPEGIAELRELLISLNKEKGITIFISSHILSELEKIATHYGIISHGKLLKTITVEELHAQCKKHTILKVSDGEKTLIELKSLGYANCYEVSPNKIRIDDNVEINKIVLALAKASIMVSSIETKDEGVEDYYLNLLKEHN